MRKMLPLLMAVALLVPISLSRANKCSNKNIWTSICRHRGWPGHMFVSPSGQSMLVDPGSRAIRRSDARGGECAGDQRAMADRIMAF